MKWYDHIQTNIPLVFLNESLIHRYICNDIFAILIHPFDIADNQISTIPTDAGIHDIPGWVRCYNNKIVVTNNLFQRCGHTDAYFSTPIRSGIDRVFAPIYGYNQYLPTCCFGAPYLLRQSDPDPDGLYLNGFEYAEVKYGSEQCIAEMYQNAYLYEHDEKTNTYIQSPGHKLVSKMNKAVIDRKVAKVSGPVGDRLADYGRIISFLLSKVKLTNEEKAILTPLLENFPGKEKLAEIANRESRINDIVKAKSESIDVLRKKFYN